MLAIKWKSGESKGYTDLYPSRWFEDEGEWDPREHEVGGPKGGRHRSRCAVRVTGNIADLDYGGEHASFNKAQHYIGVLRIIFADALREKVDQVLWRHDGANVEDFSVEDVDIFEIEVPLEGLENFDPTDIADGRDRIERMVVLRQGQATFRKNLLAAYESRCAITGCEVSQVLEAAHIMPYLGAETNHVRNGLLLRADMHTLFDLGIIKIDRDYRIVADPSIITAFDLPDQISLPKDENHHPSREAFARKWA